MGKIQVNYSELFKVLLKQTFYENGISSSYKVAPALDYKVLPTRQCKDLLTRLDMVIKDVPTQGGISVWVRTKGTSGANKLLYYKPRATDLLTFNVILKNPHFLNYNDLLAQPNNDTLYYFNNLVADAGSAKDDLHLSLDTVGVNSTDVIKKVTQSFSYVHSTNVAIGSAKLKHLQTGLEILPKSHLNEGGQSFLVYDLSGFPSGKCELLIAGVNITSVFNFTEALNESVFAVIDLFLDNLSLPNYRVVENDGSITPLRPYYTLSFKNRSTLWKYKMLLEVESPLYREIDALSLADKLDFFNRLNITSNDTNVVFNTNMITDQHFEFISDTPLPLQEKYISSSNPTNPLILKLKKYIGILAREEDVKINLPYPSVYQFDASDDPVLYSNILLNF